MYSEDREDYERRIMELEADLADAWQRADRAHADWVKSNDEHAAKWSHYYERQTQLRERQDELDERNHAHHMARLDRIATALERVAAALDGKTTT